MKIATIIVRVLFGLMFTVFGLNGFFHFIPGGPGPGVAGDFIRGLMTNHYFHVIALLQVVGGLLCLIGRYVPLGLTLLGPIIVNILLFHLCLEPMGLPIAVAVSALSLFLLYSYRQAFAGLLRP